MKMKWTACLALLLVLVITTASAAGIWYCPRCGHRNDNNYCPVCGTKKPAEMEEDEDVTESGSTSPGVGQGGGYVEQGGTMTPGFATGEQEEYTEYAYVQAILKQRMATRTGPGTQYDEPGSFFKQGTVVTVLSKAYDSRNGIWWVQTEFEYAGSLLRAYTGVKRFENLDLTDIPEEEVIGTCSVPASTEGYYGPSASYRRIARPVPAGVSCEIYGYGGDGRYDYAQIEFYDSSLGLTRRAWVSVNSLRRVSMFNDEGAVEAFMEKVP